MRQLYRLIPRATLRDSLLFLPAAWALAQRGERVMLHADRLKPFENRLVPIEIAPSLYADSLVEEKELSLPQLYYIQKESPWNQPWKTKLVGKEAPMEKIFWLGASRFAGKTQGMQIFQQLLGSCKEVETSLLSLRKRLLHSPTEKRDRCLALVPINRDPGKNWSLKKYIRLVERLQKEHWKIEIYAKNDQTPLLQAFRGKATFFLDLRLPALLHKLAGCTLFLGNDSSLSHLASLAGTPTLSLFESSSYSKLWRPTWCYQDRVVTPALPFAPILKRSVWKSHLYLWQVLRAILSLFLFCLSFEELL